MYTTRFCISGLEKFWLIAVLAAIAMAPGEHAAAQSVDLTRPASLRLVNRFATVVEHAGRRALQLDVRAQEQDRGIGGEGLAYRPDVRLGDGEIDIDFVARDRFVGVAFRILDAETYDAVYFRPGAFASADPKERAQAVQYVSHPGYSWTRLRAEAPGKYESTIGDVVIKPDAWVRVKIQLAGGRVRVFVNGGARPCLDVPQLSATRGGAVGVWVGNGSAGTFAGLKVRRRGAVPTHERRRTLDLVYREDIPRLKLDLHVPAEPVDGPFPVLVYVHGGYWDRDLRRNVPNLFLTQHGYAVASVDCRRLEHGAFPAQVQDVRQAIRFLKMNGQFRIDPERIAIGGDSSGAFLASLVALTAGTPQVGSDKTSFELIDRDADFIRSHVQAVVYYFGPADLSTIPPDNKWLNMSVLGGRNDDRERRLREWSPIAYVSRDAPPTLIIHGGKDTLVPVSDSERFEQALRRAGASVEMRLYPEGHHWLEFYESSPDARRDLLAFLTRVLPRRRSYLEFEEVR
jgi:acetyl esterase/lipase